MRIDREQLIFKALCALSEVVEQCRAGPVAPNFSVRFALAYLFAVSDGDRCPYDEFWVAIRAKDEDAYSVVMASAMRMADAQSAVGAIARGVGVELTIGCVARLASARPRIYPK